MSFLTSFCDLPQKEQRSVSSVLLTIVWGTPSFLRLAGLFKVWGRDERVVYFIARQKLIKTTDTFIADERTFITKSFGGVRRAGHDVSYLAARLAAERATDSKSFHFGDHIRFCRATC